MKEYIAQAFSEIQTLSQQFATTENFEKIAEVAERMAEAIRQGGVIYSCGNGGSMCDAMHFAEELSGRFRNDRPALPAQAIADPAHITCVGNDYGFTQVFSRYIEAFGRPGDVLLAISTSGNSENIVNAAQTAVSKGMQVVGLTGKDGGKLAPLCEVEIRVPHFGYADRIQEIHIQVIHLLIQGIEQHFV